jgi:hypothetical protein
MSYPSPDTWIVLYACFVIGAGVLLTWALTR